MAQNIGKELPQQYRIKVAVYIYFQINDGNMLIAIQEEIAYVA